MKKMESTLTLFKNKYRVESTRLKDWDYSKNAAYFVTMCVHNMRCHFGEVVDGKIKLSSIGKIVEEEWLRTGEVRDNVVLDEYVIMPNHLHGILMIMNDPETSSLSSLPNIIKGFKSACSSRILNLGCENFRWQPRYYDRIIRNEKELFYIRQYLMSNPVNWIKDKNNRVTMEEFLKKLYEPIKK